MEEWTSGTTRRPRGRRIGQRIEFFATAETEGGSAVEEERDVAAELGGDVRKRSAEGVLPARTGQREQDGGGVGGASAQARSHGNVFL